MHPPHSGVCRWLVHSVASRIPSLSQAISITCPVRSTRYFSQQPTFSSSHSILSPQQRPRSTLTPCTRLLGLRPISIQSQLRDRHPSNSNSGGDANTLSGNTIESLLSETHQGSKTQDTQPLPGPLDGFRVLDLTRVLGKNIIIFVSLLSIGTISHPPNKTFAQKNG